MRWIDSKYNKKAQVWIETVIYTLIGLAILGTLVAVATPKINAMKDESLIEQAMSSMETIYGKMDNAARTKGNRVKFGLDVGKGKFVVDGKNNQLYWIIDSALEYSSIDSTVKIGIFEVTTTTGDPYTVKLVVPSVYDIRYDGKDMEGGFDAAPNVYTITVENEGSSSSESGSKIILNFKEL